MNNEENRNKMEFMFQQEGIISGMTNLRTFRLSPFTNMPGFNIPEFIEPLTSLRTLEIHVDKKPSTLSSEMFGDYPAKLRNFVLSGMGLKTLDKNVFKGVKSPTIGIHLRNTSLSSLDSELFQNLGVAKNISLEIVDNLEFQNLRNPSSGRRPNLPEHRFLVDLHVSGNKFSCDCNLG